VQRTDADAVASEDQPLPRQIDQREGELAAEMREELVTEVLPEMHDQLGVAVAPERVPAVLERRLQFGVVEQLAVEDRHDRAGLVVNGLLSVDQADDAQAAAGKADALFEEEAFLIGPAMAKAAGHAQEAVRRDGTQAPKVDNACDTAHGPPILAPLTRACGINVVSENGCGRRVA
jgi:hypothetical protein